jgi:LPXTG-motif cell wall-anchored protein
LKTPNKLVAGFGTSLLIGAGLVLLAGAAPASAHTPEVEATCSELTVALENYTPDAGNATPNKVIVTIDGEEVANESFGETFNETYTYDGSTVGHEWTVFVDAIGKTYDKPFSGTTEVCKSEEPPVVVVPEKPEPIEITESKEKVDCDSTIVTTITTTTTTGWTLDEKSNTWTTAKPVITVTAKERAVTPAECKVVPPITVVPPTTVTPPVTPPTPVTPPVTPPTSTTPPVVETAPVADKLPSTGSDMGWTLPLAGGLLLAGIALMLVRRTRRA